MTNPESTNAIASLLSHPVWVAITSNIAFALSFFCSIKLLWPKRSKLKVLQVRSSLSWIGIMATLPNKNLQLDCQLGFSFSFVFHNKGSRPSSIVSGSIAGIIFETNLADALIPNEWVKIECKESTPLPINIDPPRSESISLTGWIRIPASKLDKYNRQTITSIRALVSFEKENGRELKINFPSPISISPNIVKFQKHSLFRRLLSIRTFRLYKA